MAVSKRTRYEVLRRDGHRCRYCGLVAAETELTVDHVVPTALGGSDDPSNLVAACKDCNSGKASSGPDAPLVADVADDAARWARALRVASERMTVDYEARKEYVHTFLAAWHVYNPEASWLPDDWRGSVARWHEQGLPAPVLVEAVNIAMGKRISATKVFVYMCGIIRNQLAKLTENARQDFASQIGGAGPVVCDDCGRDRVPAVCGGCVEAAAGQESFYRASDRWQFSDDGYRMLASVVDGHPGRDSGKYPLTLGLGEPVIGSAAA